MNETKHSQKRLSERPLLYAFLVALGPALLCGGLSLLRATLTSAPLVLAISYVCRFLTLLVGFFGLGCALRAANRGAWKYGLLHLAVASGAYAVIQAIAATREIIYINSLYPDDLAYTLFTNIGAALANVIGSFALFAAIYFVAYLAFFRGKRPVTGELPFFSRRDRRTLAAALSTLLLFLYQFIPQLINTLSTLFDEFGPTFTHSDLFYVLLDAAFLILSMLLGYTVLGIVQGHTEEA